MTIYISSNSDSGTRIVRIEGWLEGEAVAEFERVIDGDSVALRLDLSELRSADKAGLAALRAHRAAGASIVGASPYIKLLLGTRS
jgi:anti-anti-sigma regulatory factor